MLYALRPAQIADVHQPVNALFDLNESAEISQVSHPPFYARTHRIFLDKRIPGVRRQLPHTQRNPAIGRIHAQHYAINLVIHIDQLRGMLGSLRPRHFAHVHQAFNALL